MEMEMVMVMVMGSICLKVTDLKLANAAAAKVILGLWGARLDAQTAAPVDAKTELQEWAMKRKHAMPAYQLVSQTGPAHAPTFHVSVTVSGVTAEGEGTSRRFAEQAAAAKCLHALAEGNAL